MKLSVIITTSPGREEQLMYCLTMLTRQRYKPFEVLVVDDGSQDCGQVCRLFAGRLNLSYHYRPNDRCVSRSRNLGAQAARTPNLVFLDVDMLLNPFALQAYSQSFQKYPDAVVYGYMGYHQDFVAPSRWFPERKVNYLDVRFHKYFHDRLEAIHTLTQYPYLYGLGANLGLSRAIFDAVGGFNEAYDSWGQEDLELSYDITKSGYKIYFSLDVWGEHQYHERSGSYHNTKQRKQIYKMDPIQVDYPVRVIATKPIVHDLLKGIFNHYTQHSEGFEVEQKLALRKKEACLYFPDKHTSAVQRIHVRLPDTKKIDFIMMGSEFSGLEALFKELTSHPQISPPHHEMALHFFDLDDHFVRLEAWYHDQFPGGPDFLRGEATSDYFYGDDVALRMWQYCPGLKFLVVLQDPVQRAWAEYLSLYPEADPECFIKALENKQASGIFDKGLYARQINNFLKFFPKDQMLILDAQSVSENRLASLKTVCLFLGLSDTIVEPLMVSQTHEKVALPDAFKAKAEHLYLDANQKLKELLNKMPHKQLSNKDWCAAND